MHPLFAPDAKLSGRVLSQLKLLFQEYRLLRELEESMSPWALNHFFTSIHEYEAARFKAARAPHADRAEWANGFLSGVSLSPTPSPA